MADKGYVGLSGIALTGLEHAQAAFEKGATHIARAAVPADNVDLSVEAVGLLTARRSFEVNLRVLQIADDVERRAVNLLA